jgi:hypothetical protein
MVFNAIFNQYFSHIVGGGQFDWFEETGVPNRPAASH